MKQIWGLLFFCLLLSACGGDDSDNSNNPKSLRNPAADFVGTQTLEVPAGIDPATLVQLQEEQFDANALTFPTEQTYVFFTQGGLDLFNQQLDESYRLPFADLDIFAYFLVRAPSCPNWVELADIELSSQPPFPFIITLNQFTLPDVACPAILVKSYAVFKAEKLP